MGNIKEDTVSFAKVFPENGKQCITCVSCGQIIVTNYSLDELRLAEEASRVSGLPVLCPACDTTNYIQ